MLYIIILPEPINLIKNLSSIIYLTKCIGQKKKLFIAISFSGLLAIIYLSQLRKVV